MIIYQYEKLIFPKSIKSSIIISALFSDHLYGFGMGIAGYLKRAVLKVFSA